VSVRAITVFTTAIDDFSVAWPQLIAADLVYKAVVFVPLVPLVGFAPKLFMSTNGSLFLAGITCSRPSHSSPGA